MVEASILLLICFKKLFEYFILQSFFYFYLNINLIGAASHFENVDNTNPKNIHEIVARGNKFMFLICASRLLPQFGSRSSHLAPDKFTRQTWNPLTIQNDNFGEQSFRTMKNEPS